MIQMARASPKPGPEQSSQLCTILGTLTETTHVMHSAGSSFGQNRYECSTPTAGGPGPGTTIRDITLLLDRSPTTASDLRPLPRLPCWLPRSSGLRRDNVRNVLKAGGQVGLGVSPRPVGRAMRSRLSQQLLRLSRMPSRAAVQLAWPRLDGGVVSCDVGG